MPRAEVALRATPDQYRKLLQEFMRWEIAVGGPDPHMKIAVHLANEHSSRLRKAWFLGCYLAPYNVPTGEVLFSRFPSARWVLENPDSLRTWVEANWHGLSFRKECRPRRTPHKFVTHLLSYAQWLHSPAFQLLGEMKFDTAWMVVNEVKYNGRYFSLKLYETLRRAGFINEPFPDIRPKGGWSPRLTLSLLYPEHAEALNGKDTSENLTWANLLARREGAALITNNVKVDWYTLEVGLCESKQAFDWGQYPGRAHDSELEHVRRVQKSFPEDVLRTVEVRKQLFPPEALGELEGWEGRRVELGECPRWGYMWSDLRFSYAKTEDLKEPVER